jgi:hypothetical protein
LVGVDAAGGVATVVTTGAKAHGLERQISPPLAHFDFPGDLVLPFFEILQSLPRRSRGVLERVSKLVLIGLLVFAVHRGTGPVDL